MPTDQRFVPFGASGCPYPHRHGVPLTTVNTIRIKMQTNRTPNGIWSDLQRIYAHTRGKTHQNRCRACSVFVVDFSERNRHALAARRSHGRTRSRTRQHDRATRARDPRRRSQRNREHAALAHALQVRCIGSVCTVLGERGCNRWGRELSRYGVCKLRSPIIYQRLGNVSREKFGGMRRANGMGVAKKGGMVRKKIK